MKSVLSLPGLLLVLLASLTLPVHAEDSVPEDLAYVHPVADHQLVVFKDCSGEYCRHTFHLRRVELNGVLETLCKAPIAELNTPQGLVLDHLESLEGNATLRLHLKAADTGEPVKPRVLSASDDCQYRLSQ